MNPTRCVRSWWRWMPGWGQSQTISFTPVLSSLVGYRRQRGSLMLAIMNCWQWSEPCSSSITGSREPSSHSWHGLSIRTGNISVLLKGSILARPNGLCSSPHSIACVISPDLEMSSLMHFPGSLWEKRPRPRVLRSSFLDLVMLLRSPETSRKSFGLSQLDSLDPLHDPTIRLYVPAGQRLEVLEWGHSSRLACLWQVQHVSDMYLTNTNYQEVMKLLNYIFYFVYSSVKITMFSQKCSILWTWQQTDIKSWNLPRVKHSCVKVFPVELFCPLFCLTDFRLLLGLVC